VIGAEAQIALFCNDFGGKVGFELLNLGN